MVEMIVSLFVCLVCYFFKVLLRQSLLGLNLLKVTAMRFQNISLLVVPNNCINLSVICQLNTEIFTSL